MVNIAIVGGTGGVGRAIVAAIKAQTSHNLIVLTQRKLSKSDATTINYSDIDAVQSLFETEKIDVVISALSIYNESGFQDQLNIIEAADRSTCTKRFIPSEFGVHATEDYCTKNHNPTFPRKLETTKRLESSSLEFTLIATGIFMDYMFYPEIPSSLQMIPAGWWLDLNNNRAAIPGTGDQPFVFTHTTDVGRFVAAILDIVAWKKRYTVIGDRLTFHELIELAEKAQGCVIEKNYDDAAVLSKGKCTLFELEDTVLTPELSDVLQDTVSQVGLLVPDGVADLDPDLALNNVFPEIEPLTIREGLSIWKSKK